MGAEENLGLADSSLGLRLALPAPFALSLEATVLVQASRLSDDGAGRLPLGYGEWGTDLRLAAGRSLGQTGWITGDLGLRLQTGQPPPTLLATVSAGLRPADPVQVEIVFRVFRPLSDPDAPVPDDQWSNRPDTRYIGYGLHLGYRLPGALWLGGGIEGGNGHQVAPNLKLAAWRTF